jgi:hypothetical protein
MPESLVQEGEQPTPDPMERSSSLATTDLGGEAL